MVRLFTVALGLQCLILVVASSSRCSRLNMIVALSHMHIHPPHLPHLTELPHPHLPGPVHAARRFIFNSHHHHLNLTSLLKLNELAILSYINKTLPASAETEKSCRFDIGKATSSDISLLKQLYKLGFKLCSICDHFEAGNSTCNTVGVCPKTSLCYRGYNSDYSSHNTGSLAYLHPHAVSHGCCSSTDKKCHYQYRYKVQDSKHNTKANYTLYTCTTDVCNRDYAIHTKMSTFFDKVRQVDGAWTSWSHWSSCSLTCGTGTVSRHRSCTNPAPKYGGHSCSGSSTDTKHVTCHTSHCPRNGHWGSWGSYSECSKTCGGGHKTRHRSCNHPTPAYGGNSCHGSSSYSSTCNSNPCPVDGGFSSWSSWSSCSRTCLVGVKHRTRTCTSPAPAHGGKSCSGTLTESKSCDAGACPVWSSWFNGQCSVSCGNGTMDRIRHCSSGHDEDCPGTAFENVHCNSGPCPIDGTWGLWGSWNTCSLTCGGGQRSRSRQCDNPAPQFNGADCPGARAENGACNTQHCPVWSDYFEASPCSVTCGNGVITLQRNCTYGTKVTDCVGSAYDEKPCSNPPCI